MQVWICKSKVDGKVVDIIQEQPFPDVLKTFICTKEDMDDETYRAYKNPVNLDPPVSQATG